MTQANGRDPRGGGAVDVHQIADTLWKSYPEPAIVQALAQISWYQNATLFIFGQESNPTTWRLAHMNLAIHGIEANLGSAPADTFLGDQHHHLKADFASPICGSIYWCGNLRRSGSTGCQFKRSVQSDDCEAQREQLYNRPAY